MYVVTCSLFEGVSGQALAEPRKNSWSCLFHALHLEHRKSKAFNVCFPAARETLTPFRAPTHQHPSQYGHGTRQPLENKRRVRTRGFQPCFKSERRLCLTDSELNAAMSFLCPQVTHPLLTGR
jgi:hypothetical protein